MSRYPMPNSFNNQKPNGSWAPFQNNKNPPTNNIENRNSMPPAFSPFQNNSFQPSSSSNNYGRNLQNNFTEEEFEETLTSYKRVKKEQQGNNNIEIEQGKYTPKTLPKYPDNDFSSEMPTKQKTASKTSGYSTQFEKQNAQPTDPKKKAPNKNQKNTPVSKGNDTLIDIEKNEGGAFDDSNFEDSIPEWAKKENMRDASGRMSGDPQYDPTTLYIPPGALNKMTPTVRQYWQIKSQNNDKIVLFKLGKFYEVFFEDAVICHKELDLSWVGNKMKVGFPEKTLDRYAYILVNKGFKVCVVEQTETPKQMEERYRNQRGAKSERTIKREPVQIMSKGTYVDPGDSNYEAKVLLSIRCRKNMIAVAFLEIGSNVISMGAFEDDENFTLFKTFVSQIRPVEVLYETIETPPNIVKILKNSPLTPLMSPINDPNAWNTMQAIAEFEKYYGPTSNWPGGLQNLLKLRDDNTLDQIMLSMSGMIVYLTKMLIVENVLCSARYEIYDPKTTKLTRMVIDSQALQHLEILEVEYSTKNAFDGSLLSYIDKTSSPFGKRLLKKWICAPLLDINAINDRLDAIEDLEYNSEARDEVMKGLKLLPDLERTIAKIYHHSVKRNDNIVMFEDVPATKLREFKKLIENLMKARNLIGSFSECTFKSNLMRRLTTFDDYKHIFNKESDNMPELRVLLKEMSEFVSWEGPKHDIPVPRPGIDSDYDGCKQEIDRIEIDLTNYLKNIQMQFGGTKEISYVHTKHRYEIEIPAKLVEGNNKPREFEFSSRKQGFERFITQKIKQTVERLEDVEEKLSQTLNVFVCFLFSYFHKHYVVWDRFIEGLAQLDCLCSLSLTSFMSEGVMCRPRLFPPNEKIFLDVKNMRHPCLSLNKPNFVSNDIILGDVDGAQKNVMILTGPNMGGKSTILRQACIAAILAQIGCYLPASSCELSVVDRIFTRIGASDKLSEGKSTFFIEMEETVNVVNYGTKNSLAIMDELGRGTSTFDGVAIAYSVLRYIIKRMGCRVLFATHYHVLLDEFREHPGLSFFHMASNTDKERQRVTFLYKLKEGECGKSFGLNIAKISGLRDDIIKVAAAKAEEFERNLNLRDAVSVTKAVEKIMKGLSVGNSNPEEGLEILKQSLATYIFKK